MSIGNSTNVKVGQAVTAIGNVGGNGTLTAASGAITGLGRTITVSDDEGGTARLAHLIRTDANLVPGDSGGPLLDSAGHVIGMDAAASSELDFRRGGNVGYAIPINRAVPIASQITAGHSSTVVHIGATPLLGVTLDTSSPFGETAGVLVAGVKSGSPAARAGIESGDVIVAVGGHTVRTRAGLVAQLVRRHPGDTVRVAWVDQFGSRNSANVKLASGPPQ